MNTRLLSPLKQKDALTIYLHFLFSIHLPIQNTKSAPDTPRGIYTRFWSIQGAKRCCFVSYKRERTSPILIAAVVMVSERKRGPGLAPREAKHVLLKHSTRNGTDGATPKLTSIKSAEILNGFCSNPVFPCFSPPARPSSNPPQKALHGGVPDGLKQIDSGGFVWVNYVVKYLENSRITGPRMK